MQADFSPMNDTPVNRAPVDRATVTCVIFLKISAAFDISKPRFPGIGQTSFKPLRTSDVVTYSKPVQ